MPEHTAKREIGLYIRHARRMLEVAEHNLADGFFESAINRAYYATFYAASAVLATQGLSRSKHSGVISAFRQRFIRPGLIEIDYGDIYGRLMDDRHVSDYDVEAIVEPQRAQIDLDDARRFVDRIEQYLQEGGWL
jgi:uncharacterized protein (UPF0332 family)